MREIAGLTAVFTFVLVLYAAAAHALARYRGMRQDFVIGSYLAPALVAGMTIHWLAMQGRAPVGSPEADVAFEWWFHTWPVLMLLLLLNTFVQIGWVVAAAIRRSMRRWIPIPITGLALTMLAFLLCWMTAPMA